MRARITGSGELHKGTILPMPGSTKSAGRSGRHQVRLEEIVLPGICKIPFFAAHMNQLCAPSFMHPGQFLNGTVYMLGRNKYNTK